ncbi:MAG: hypothetical protein ACE5H2_03435 [Terriglobia bacterium]
MNPDKHKFPLLLIALLGLPLWLSAIASGQDLPAELPTLEETLEILRDSLWAQEKFILILTGRLTDKPFLVGRMRVPGGTSPERLPAIYLVRWESAKPVTQAFARLAELGEHTLAQFLAQPPSGPVDLDSEYYVITVKAKEPPRPSSYDLFAGFMAAELQERAELRTSRRLSVQAERVLRTGVGAAAAVHFYFPRAGEARPLIAAGEDWVEFFFTARHSTTLKVKFKREALRLADGLPKR